MTDADDSITVPVTIGFDSSKPIGGLRILKSALPPNADFMFSIAVTYKDGARLGPNPKGPLVGPYELVQVALLQDSDYLGYLKKTGTLQDFQGWYDAAMLASNEAGFVGFDAAQTIRVLNAQVQDLQERERQYLDSIERTEMILNGADPKALP